MKKLKIFELNNIAGGVGAMVTNDTLTPPVNEMTTGSGDSNFGNSLIDGSATGVFADVGIGLGALTLGTFGAALATGALNAEPVKVDAFSDLIDLL